MNSILDHLSMPIYNINECFSDCVAKTVAHSASRIKTESIEFSTQQLQLLGNVYKDTYDHILRPFVFISVLYLTLSQLRQVSQKCL